MKELKIKVLGKTKISFTNATLSFIREEQTTKELTISYQNGTGQSLTANQILFTQGTNNQIGFLQIKVLNNSVLNGKGTFTISVTNYPTNSEVNAAKSITIDGSVLSISFYYNSRPVTNDIEISVFNKTVKVIDATVFLNNFTDYDGDSISEIAFYGDVSNIKVDGVSYVEGTYISLSLFSSNKVTYTPNDTDNAYEVSLTYKIKDTAGNTSI